jgi:spectinomycin phosphotransferase
VRQGAEGRGVRQGAEGRGVRQGAEGRGVPRGAVRDRPAGFGEHEVRLALAEGWRIDARAMRYAAVGGGSYHWAVRDGAGRRWFVTVDDLDDKPWLGNTRPTVLAGLRSAMETAVALRRNAGLAFVVAPVPGCGGATVRPVGPAHAVAVFPFLSGATGRWGEPWSAPERAALVDMLAALHQSTPVVAAGAPVRVTGLLPMRETLEAALRELGRPWSGGPYAEPARALLAGAEDQVRRLLENFDRLADVVQACDPAITHGEPHPANVMRVGTHPMLIDWDTVGLAAPERDLWLVISETGEGGRRYAELTGRAVDPDALALYRLRWALNDISAFVNRLRREHGRTADAEHAWLALKETVVRATGGGG